MGMTQLLSGEFVCPDCGREYMLERVPAYEAICVDCGVELTEITDEDELEGEEEEEEE